MTAITARFDSRSRVSDRRPLSFDGLHAPGLPFHVIALLPLFWALGLGYFSFVIASVPMLLGLMLMKPIRIPRGFGAWALYVGWMIASAAMLDPTLTRYLSFALRGSNYVAATIIFLYVYNVDQRHLPTGRVLGILGGVFVFTAVIGGYLGLLLGEVRFDTPMSRILPGSMLSNSFVNNIVRPPFAQTQSFLGFPINRPAMPFSFTNDWGATLVPGTFLAIAAAGRARRYRRLVHVVALLALIPMAVSANRGLWIALICGVLYVAFRRASSGQMVLAIRIIAVLLVLLTALLVSPLGEIVGGRATSTHSVDARSDIYSDVLERVPESPVLGFGAPLANPNPNRPAIGTHGMFWTALFSQGIPGAALFVTFWVGMARRTGTNIRNQEHLWLHLAVASSLPTMLYYDHLPAALPMMMIAAALVLRDQRVADQRREHVLAGAAP
ncbi:MAG: O-antigen ligase family protein [Acidimicrobiales bacterium]